MDINVPFAIGLVVLLIFTYFYFRRENKIMEEQDKLHRTEKWINGEDIVEYDFLW